MEPLNKQFPQSKDIIITRWDMNQAYRSVVLAHAADGAVLDRPDSGTATADADNKPAASHPAFALGTIRNHLRHRRSLAQQTIVAEKHLTADKTRLLPLCHATICLHGTSRLLYHQAHNHSHETNIKSA